MVINVHAGHNPDGKVACGAVGLIKESTEARKVKDLVIKYLKALGHSVYDCTVENGKSQSDVLNKIVKLESANKADLDVSIHFNAGGGTGVEVLVSGSNNEAKNWANNVVKAIADLGFKNRGVKIRPELYVLRKSTAKDGAILVECCFVDSKADTERYNAEKMAKAIVKGLTGQTVKDSPKPDTSFKVKIKADVLNVRSGADIKYKVNGQVKRGYVYTIVEVRDSWGKLKSGLGWININPKYVDRV